MATEQDLTTFHKGEQVRFTVLAKNPDGTALTDPASATLHLTIGQTEGATPVVEFSSSPQVVLSTPASSIWTINLTPTDLNDLTEGKRYFYNVWTVDGSNVPLVQAKGEFTLLASIEPAA